MSATSHVTEMLRLLGENWFLQEPAFFALYCQQQLDENVRMDCPVRCGQGRIEYNPLALAHKNYDEIEQLMRIEMIRLYLKHPYERQPEGCCFEAMAIGSNVTIADGYCTLHKEKLPLRDPAYYHLPLGQYYEWYAKAIQRQRDDDAQSSPKPNTSSAPDTSSSSPTSPSPSEHDSSQAGSPEQSITDPSADTSALWREDSLRRQQINDLIERTTDWGSLPAEIIERIKASTRARIDNRLIMQGFQSAILSSRRQLTRMRPNRRTGFLQMGSTRQFDTRLLVAIDTSGSITAAMLADFFSAINRMFRYGMAQIDVCQFDAAMGPITPMQRASADVVVKGRGGTSYQPVFDYVAEHPDAYDGLLVLTDGQAPAPVLHHRRMSDQSATPRPLIPVLWVCNDRAAFDAQHQWMEGIGRCCHL